MTDPKELAAALLARVDRIIAPGTHTREQLDEYLVPAIAFLRSLESAGEVEWDLNEHDVPEPHAPELDHRHPDGSQVWVEVRHD